MVMAVAGNRIGSLVDVVLKAGRLGRGIVEDAEMAKDPRTQD